MTSILHRRTRLPLYAYEISMPLTLAAFGLFMIPVSVGFNEWEHTFRFREEFFAAPIQWEFVIGGWFSLAVEGILLQANRMSMLPDQTEEAP